MDNSAESYQKLTKLLLEIGQVNRKIIGESRKLNIVLLNLQIEGAKIHEPNAVGVIAKELMRNIESIETILENEMAEEKELIEAMEVIRNALGIKE